MEESMKGVWIMLVLMGIVADASFSQFSISYSSKWCDGVVKIYGDIIETGLRRSKM
jgi:hypothetical protein